MVLYKLKGITKKEVHELLEGRNDSYNYIATKRDDTYLIHSQHDRDRTCFGQVELIEVGDTLLCELSYEDRLWLAKEHRFISVTTILILVGILLSVVFYSMSTGTFDSPSLGYLISSGISMVLTIFCIYYNGSSSFRNEEAKRKILLAFEDWFDEYL